MKKLTVILCLGLMLALVLTSCGGDPAQTTPGDTTPTIPVPDSAASLWTKIDAAMDGLQSYESTMTMDTKMYVSGYEVKSTGVGQAVECGIGTDDYYYYESSTMIIKAPELMMDESYTTLSAYSDGKMFSSYVSSDTTQKFYSVLSAEEFMAHKLKDDLMDLDWGDCTKSSFVQNEDKTWVLSFSGYTARVIDKISEDMGTTEEIMGADIVDLEITMIADEAFRLKECTFNFIFKTGTVTPTATVKISYGKYNGATPVADAIRVEEYQQIDDVRLIDNIADMLADLCAADKGAFTLELEQNIFLAGTSAGTYKEKDIISYGRTNGSYFYTATVELDGETMTIDYRGGQQTVVVDGEKYTNYQSTSDAKLFVDGLINSASYAATNVQSVTKVSDGVYALNCAVTDSAAYAAVFQNLGGTYQSGKQTLIVTVKNDRLERIESSLELIGVATNPMGQRQELTLEIKTVNTFQYDLGTGEGGTDPVV